MYLKEFNTMFPISKIISTIDNATEYLGRYLSWAAIVMAMVTGLVVFLRYGLNLGSIFAQEAITYLHGGLFMLGSIYTLKSGKHVRVDVFYRQFNNQTRAWINAIGSIVFLVPFSLFVFFISWDYVEQSWATREISADPGGIPAVYLLKSLLPAMAIGLLLQGTAEVLRSILTLLHDADFSG